MICKKRKTLCIGNLVFPFFQLHEKRYTKFLILLEPRMITCVSEYNTNKKLLKLKTTFLLLLTWILIECSGVSMHSESSYGDRNFTPSSVISASFNKLTIWNPPESVSKALFQFMNLWRPPAASKVSMPGRLPIDEKMVHWDCFHVKSFRL